jgi:aminoglycoside phosphotransferase (APT) family kinase protein
VFEHGDFSPPNVLHLRGGGVGVLDWELAEPHGLPASDLFFFLTWVAWAREGAESEEERTEAFHRAFFGRDAWARPFVLDYARELGLSPDALTPLFALTWARNVARFVDRLDGSSRPFARESSDWLRQNRYYAAWRHSLSHAAELHWGTA